MPALREIDQVGKREELADYITNVQAQATPYLSMVAKAKKPNQTLIQFQMEAYPDTGHKGVLDGKDVASFDHVPRVIAQALPQKFWWNPSVTDFADESNVAGESKTEMARQKVKGLVILKRAAERRLLSNSEQSIENGAATPYETRGILQWLNDSAQSVYPVDADFRTPTASRHTTALDTLTEEAFGDLMQSAYNQRKDAVALKGIVGVALKRHISKFSTYVDTVASKTAARTFNQDAKSRALVNVIDRLVMDTGSVDLMISSFLATNETTGAQTDHSTRSGVFVDMSMLDVCYTRMPRVRDLEDRGGGPRANIDMILAHRCKNPLGHAVVYTDSDS